MRVPFISICIPSYNRPNELLRLLNSVDTNKPQEFEIVICEDNSPLRLEIRQVVNNFKEKSKLEIKYYENEDNYGYDRNLRELVIRSTGQFIIFMGDDDLFIPKALDKYYKFLSENSHLGYILKSHKFIHKNGLVENFRYYKGTKYFPPGKDTLVELFRKSVFISGFIINRNYILDYLIDEFDGTLLFQLYLLSEISLRHYCAYFDEPLTLAIDEGVPYFGSSRVEKDLYTPGTITIQNSINFLKGFFKITEYIDHKYNINITEKVKIDMSKYFYPSLAIQREKGLRMFIQYVRELNKIGFNCTIYYYIYFFALLFLGKNFCNIFIIFLKKIFRKTPKL